MCLVHVDRLQRKTNGKLTWTSNYSIDSKRKKIEIIRFVDSTLHSTENNVKFHGLWIGLKFENAQSVALQRIFVLFVHSLTNIWQRDKWIACPCITLKHDMMNNEKKMIFFSFPRLPSRTVQWARVRVVPRWQYYAVVGLSIWPSVLFMINAQNRIMKWDTFPKFESS